ncbi:MAG: bacteriohemerythrin [Polyangiales bacterium]
MEAFRWDACFVTGIAEIDAQHHTLVDLINRLGDVVTGDRASSPDDIERVFGELAQYAAQHFHDEEGLMHAHGLDPRFVDAHRRAHARFIEEITAMHGSLASDGPLAAEGLLRFLSHWLAWHILGQDQRIAAQRSAIEAGQSPEQAYHSVERPGDPATGALLHALDGLFHQVSERNRALSQLNRTLEARVAERTRAIAEANQRLEDLAMTDVLTGLPNRRHAIWRLEREWLEADRRASPLSCLMIDADGFKRINDAYGHDAGDGVLRALARALVHAVRTDDVVCRLGGDEFLVLCPRTPLEGALQVAESLRGEVAALRVPAGDGAWRGSVSVGVASRTDEMLVVEDLIRAADRGAYLAKQAGRDRVATAQRR